MTARDTHSKEAARQAVQERLDGRRTAAERKQRALRTAACVVKRWRSPRQVEAAQNGHKRDGGVWISRNVLLKSPSRTLIWIVQSDIWNGIVVRV